MTLIIHQQDEIEVTTEGDYVVIEATGVTSGHHRIAVAKDNVEALVQALRENAETLLKVFYES